MAETIRVGVLGAGWGAGLHLEGFRRTPGVVLAGIASRTRAPARARAAAYGIPLIAESVEELVKAVDVVSVATPPAAHPEAVAAAAAAGRHVLCDKPIAIDAASARSMLDAVSAAGVRHASGFIWRSDPALERMRAMAAEGAIGRLVEIHSVCPLGVPQLPMTWMYEAASGGGALAQHGSHVIDRARWLVGSEITRVCGRLAHDIGEAPDAGRFHDITEAFAWAREHAGRSYDGPVSPVSADTGYEFSAEFGSGVRARFWEAWHLPGSVDDAVTIFGSAGCLEWRGTGGLRLHRPWQETEILNFAGAAGSGAATPREIGLAKWARLAGRFVEAIRNGADTGHPTIEDGWRVAAVSDAVRRSSASGGWEDVA
jgi:predicted dehydrogenase